MPHQREMYNHIRLSTEKKISLIADRLDECLLDTSVFEDIIGVNEDLRWLELFSKTHEDALKIRSQFDRLTQSFNHYSNSCECRKIM